MCTFHCSRKVREIRFYLIGDGDFTFVRVDMGRDVKIISGDGDDSTATAFTFSDGTTGNILDLRI